jgi:hypothetical protein
VAITELQFYLGTTEDPKVILSAAHAFLAAHRDLAYSAEEVSQAVCLKDETVLFALEELAYLGAIEGRELKQGLYFKYVRDLQPNELEAAEGR